MTLQVDADHRVPFLFAGGEHHAVADEARVVDEHVEPAEGGDRLLDEMVGARPVGNVVGVRDGFASAARISSTTSCAGPVSAPRPSPDTPRSFTTTLAPSAANASACARPMPRPAPVTITMRPSHNRAMNA
jgi:hypothetical protein